MNDITKPGRLGDANATLITDHRTDRRIANALTQMPSFAEVLGPISGDAPYSDCLAYCMAFEEMAAAGHPIQWRAMPEYPNVETSTEIIKGVDGNDVNLHLHMPKGSAEHGPCIVHTHGGGMVLMTAADPSFVRWRNELAASGLRVVGVEFRNGGGKLGNHPFPAGLNDCASTVNWVNANKARLGITSVVISGESGGGNLSIATTLKAKQENWLDQINGVYAFCPYISGSYADPPRHLVSLRENNGYSIDCDILSAMVTVYDPEKRQSDNPLSWPLQASTELLAGLPPHAISVNELDPLRDEGIEFYRMLLAAGVVATARTVHGTQHAGDLSFPDIAPDLYAESLRSLHRFAHSV